MRSAGKNILQFTPPELFRSTNTSTFPHKPTMARLPTQRGVSGFKQVCTTDCAEQIQ